MDDRIRRLLDQITSLDEELREVLHEQETRLFYQIHGKRVEFERSIRDTHLRLKTGLVRWFLAVRPLNYFTAPVIYGFIVPLAFLDICITIYQATCFPIYGIPKARRSNYIVMDHQQLAYLNIVEKFHCLYCSYATGLVAYAREIAARTEQYFCPIKHARRVLGSHARYAHFLDYGDAADFSAKLEKFRSELAKEEEQAPSPRP